MQNELQTWVDLKCIARKKRKDARNIIDVKWVVKYKWEEAAISATTGASNANSEQTRKKTIRARLTIRGFKDADKWNIDGYAGTSSRYAQKILISEAALRKWPICAADISKAFLQGVTYEELAKITGETLREVNFVLPRHNVEQLRKIKGYETFDPDTEVLHCVKPGTGSVDAPRAFSLKLADILTKLKLTPSRVDPEIWYLHRDNNLCLVMTKHVDDLKVTGPEEDIVYVFKAIESTFGAMKLNWSEFTNCGIRHVQDPKTYIITLDQIHYITTLRNIAHPQLTHGKPEDDADEDLHKLYMSLLGAVAYLSHTRPDIVVFVCAMQRHLAKPKVEHAKKLNKLLRWIQRHPKKLTYRPPAQGNTKTHLRVVSDAAFKRETDDGYALRGALFLRCMGSPSNNTDTTCFTAKQTISHPLEWACKSQKRVARSTFSAELLSAGESLDQGILCHKCCSNLMLDRCQPPRPAHSAQAKVSCPWLCTLMPSQFTLPSQPRASSHPQTKPCCATSYTYVSCLTTGYFPH
jgi:hypothetical protein